VTTSWGPGGMTSRRHNRGTEDAHGLDEDEAIELATRAVHAYRSEQRAKRRQASGAPRRDRLHFRA
jgi:hypothetical protein